MLGSHLAPDCQPASLKSGLWSAELSISPRDAMRALGGIGGTTVSSGPRMEQGPRHPSCYHDTQSIHIHPTHGSPLPPASGAHAKA